MRLATLAYLRRYTLSKDDPRQLSLLQETYTHAHEAQVTPSLTPSSQPFSPAPQTQTLVQI
jgi:hypothetical protein